MSETANDMTEKGKAGSARRSRITRRNLGAAVAAAVAALSTTSGSAGAHSIRPFWRNPFRGGGGGKGTGHKCFFQGTRLTTPQGKVAVEDLQAGDLILTTRGDFKPIKCVSSTSLTQVSGQAWQPSELPIRVMQGAIAEGIPSQDVLLSVGHHVEIDGVLIPVGDLVNGTTIIVDPADSRDELTYYHVALDGHDVVTVEGLACETLLETAPETAAAPIMRTKGGVRTLTSRLRSAASPWIDVRTRADQLRDRLEDRADTLRAA